MAYLDKGYVFSIFPTVSSSKPLSQVTFSEESYDFNKALLFRSKRKLGGIRIYKNIECIKEHSNSDHVRKARISFAECFDGAPIIRHLDAL